MEAFYVARAVVYEILSKIIITPALWMTSYKKHFDFYGLNPTALTEQQASQPAILYLHADYHNQSGALGLARKIQKAGISPMFTVNLPYSDEIPDHHESTLRNRVSEISKLYREKGKDLHLIILGHSRGGTEGCHYAFCEEKEVGVHVDKVISLVGRVKVIPAKYRGCHPDFQNRVNQVTKGIFENQGKTQLFTIGAAYDSYMPLDAVLLGKDDAHRHVVRTCHLGIIFSSEAADKVVEYIKA